MAKKSYYSVIKGETHYVSFNLILGLAVQWWNYFSWKENTSKGPCLLLYYIYNSNNSLCLLYTVDCGGKYKSGPFSEQCLSQWWEESGCSVEGTLSPINRNPTTSWDTMRTSEVKSDMNKYFLGALNGKQEATVQCFGEPAIFLCKYYL